MSCSVLSGLLTLSVCVILAVRISWTHHDVQRDFRGGRSTTTPVFRPPHRFLVYRHVVLFRPFWIGRFHDGL